MEHVVLECDDMKAMNGFASEKVKPLVTSQSSMEGGLLLHSLLHKASWNMMRLGKR